MGLKINVGVTGYTGFIGSSLSRYLFIKKNINPIYFDDNNFRKIDKIIDFVKKCDFIVHLAGVNRSKDLKKLYDTNIQLMSNLLKACDLSNSRPHIIFASSTQEKLDNLRQNRNE